jgi:hypothetical protein
MNRNFLIVCLILAVLFPDTAHSQDFTEEQKKERCQNNRKRIDELEKESKILRAELSKMWTNEEIEKATDKMMFVRKLKNLINNYNRNQEEWDRLARIFREYKPGYEFGEQAGDRLKFLSDEWFTDLEKIIGKKIDAAKLLKDKRAELANKKNEIDKQLASHRNNLIALGCDQPAGACTLAGTWVHITEGIGTTTWTITSDGNATEEGKGYAEGKATLKGNTLHIEWQTKNGYSGYYEWRLNSNCSSDDGELVFKSGGTGTHKSTVKKS